MGSGEAKICPLISTMPSEVSQRVEGAGPIITPRPLPAEPQVAMATPSDGDRGQCRRPLTAHSLLINDYSTGSKSTASGKWTLYSHLRDPNIVWTKDVVDVFEKGVMFCVG
jgi:hypothetical protein